MGGREEGARAGAGAGAGPAHSGRGGAGRSARPPGLCPWREGLRCGGNRARAREPSRASAGRGRGCVGPASGEAKLPAMGARCAREVAASPRWRGFPEQPLQASEGHAEGGPGAPTAPSLAGSVPPWLPGSHESLQAAAARAPEVGVTKRGSQGGLLPPQGPR